MDNGLLWFKTKAMEILLQTVIYVNILAEANKLTHKDRQNDYDSPERNFKHIAEISSAILKKPISAKDVCMIMIATKLSREQFKHKRDNLIDLAGYAWVLSRIEKEG